MKWAWWVQDQTDVRDGGPEPKASVTQADPDAPYIGPSAARVQVTLLHDQRDALSKGSGDAVETN